MRHVHLIIEVHCLHGVDENDNDGTIPKYCRYGVRTPGYHCMENKCKYVAYTDAPYEIAFAGEKGEVPYDACIGFGGDMEPENVGQQEVLSLKKLWEVVCRGKIEDAYEDYMKKSWLQSQEKRK
jgi:hypothetical protein